MSNIGKSESNVAVRLPPDLQEAVEALAENLAQSEPLILYRQAQARLDADHQAHTLLERLSAAQADLRARQGRGGAITQADIDQLRVLQHQVQTNRTIMDYAQAQQAAIAYLPEVNQEISQLLGVDFAALAGPASC